MHGFACMLCYLPISMSQNLLRDAVGALIVQGCTGGTFLSQDVAGLHSWVEMDGRHLRVKFDNIPREQQLRRWEPELKAFLDKAESEREFWWLWNNPVSTPECRQPPWWDIRNIEDLDVSPYRL